MGIKMPQIKDFHAKRVLCPVCVNRGMEAHINFFPAGPDPPAFHKNRPFSPGLKKYRHGEMELLNTANSAA
jgi:hypothetical protein